MLSAKVKAVVPHLRHHPDFPLRRFIGCAVCGTPLTGSWSRGRTARYPYYHCRACKKVSVRREVLESRFVELLERLQPNASYMRLFNEVVLDVWKGRRSEAVEIAKVATQRAEDLRGRLDRVEVAFTQTQSIDGLSYERQRDKLREDLALLEMESAEAKLDELDIEGVLAFAENALTDATGLWVAASLDQKQRLQDVLFPEGLTFDREEFGTAVTCLVFKQLDGLNASGNGMASLSIPSWDQITGFLTSMRQLRDATGFAA
jgi:site-specific DNA recombinase